MIRTSPRNSASRIAWNDLEALPLYAAAALVVVTVGYGLADAGLVLQGMTAKTALIVGCLGLRSAWLGMHEVSSD